MFNMVKTVAGFLVTMIEKSTPLKFSRDGFEDVFNYLQISEKLHTSGQPTAAQFESIKNAGFDHVINLLPEGHENALNGQAEILDLLGLPYTEIPVHWNNPTEDNFSDLVELLTEGADQKLWVHCAANARVSAFIYRYRRDVLGEDDTLARAEMLKIWNPNSLRVWKAFVSDAPRK